MDTSVLLHSKRLCTDDCVIPKKIEMIYFTKVDECVDKHHFHFYIDTDNNYIVEIHIDNVYIYENNRGNILL